MEFNGAALFVTALIAVLAPLISEIPIGLRLPMVVVEVGLGVVRRAARPRLGIADWHARDVGLSRPHFSILPGGDGARLRRRSRKGL